MDALSSQALTLALLLITFVKTDSVLSEKDKGGVNKVGNGRELNQHAKVS